MALVNPNIAMSFRQPEIQAPNALAQFAQIQQIQGGRQAQELARFQLGAAQRAEATQNALADAYGQSVDPATGTINYNKLTGLLAAGSGASQIPGIEKTRRELETAEITKRKLLQEIETGAITQKNIQSQIDERAFTTQKKKLDFGWNAVGSAPNPQAAIAELTKGVKDGVFDMKSATAEIQQLQNMAPEQYQQYRVEKILSILDAKDKLPMMLPKTRDRDIGGQIQTIQNNPMLPGYGLPVAGGTIPKTATIGERTAQGQLGVAQGQLAVAQQRLAQDAQGVTYQQDAQGNIVALPSRLAAGGAPMARPVTGQDGAPIKGKPSAFAEKVAAQRVQMDKDLSFAIKELGDITKDGGLIDQSTGSGAGRLADIGMSFVGQATPGAIAIGKIEPVADLALKMVPRFEGPQSDKDTASYKAAAGQLADPTLPTKIRKEAGKTVLRLMQQRKNQFATGDMAAEGVAPASDVRSQADAILRGGN
jgi:hypothetical protein